MGHINGNHLYEKLGRKIDSLQMRTPWNETFHKILKELYSTEEADLVVKMPYTMSSARRISKVTGIKQARVKVLLDSLCSKGLVMDLHIRRSYLYMPSPLIIGIFEFTMMRTRGELNSKAWAELFHQYLNKDFYEANFGNGKWTTLMRTIPHESVITDGDHVEVLDYESATRLVEKANKFSVGICSCRHEKLHIGEKQCDIPLEKCSSFGTAADYLIRNGLAREVSKTEMLENIEHSRENALVLNADNVKKNITYICHCCKDCCNTLRGISKFGYPRTIVTSNFIAEMDRNKCTGCGKCSRACPINAIEMLKIQNPSTYKSNKPKRKRDPRIDKSICLGCGVCALKCESGSMALIKRDKRVFTPENTFERVILMSLDRGTLQNQIFDNPQSMTQEFMRGFLGGFLRLTPVKKALLSDTLRSSFLDFMKTGVKRQGKNHVLDI